MTDQTLRRLIGVMATLLVVVVAAGVLVTLSRGGSGGATTPPPGSSFAIASAGASPASSASSVPTPSLTSAATTAPTASASGLPSASPPPVPLATLTFLAMRLDPTGQPESQPRIITFSTDGAGTISAKLATSSGATPAKTHMCLQIGKKVLGCNDITSGTFTGTTKQAHATWQVTVQGTASTGPTVDLTLTFQSLAPSVKIEHARFDGTDFPDTNGIQVRFTARGTGDAHLVAEWGGHPFPYEIDLFDETSGAGNVTLPNQGPSTNVDQTLPVSVGAWRLVLQNVENGFGATDLTATIGWP
ncbi:MAG TPA: hypothetical protein VGQ31_00235 [Candidatus Limnocylindrales bacterium]|nr:hypothetical protein [Candidatus Limnocylindrales bacterium]